MKRKLIIGCVLLMALLGGFLQEFIKVNINYQIEQGEGIPDFFSLSPEQRRDELASRRVLAPMDYYYSHKPFDALNYLNRNELMGLKWGVTLFFVLFFLWSNAKLLMLITQETAMLRALWLGYLAFFGLAFAIYAAGFILGETQTFYPISRRITGALQSLIPVMVLIPAWWIIKNGNKNELQS